MFNNTNGYTLSDIAAVSGNRSGTNGWDDGNGWWIILLFLFALGGGWGGNGFGGGYGSGATTREEIAYGFDMNGLENGVRGIQQGLCDGFYAVNNSLLTGFNGVQSAMCQGFSGLNNAITVNGYDTLNAINANTVAGMQNTSALSAQLSTMAAAQASCCCETQRALERGFADTNYNLATQACETRRAISDSARDIIENNNAGVRSILDFITQDKIATLQAENQSLKFAASQQAQNAYLVNQLRDPCPVPAYFVPNPNAGYDARLFASTCGCF